jgi:hypothetical protein
MVPRVLVAISSCEQYERDGLNAPPRETWLADAKAKGWDYKFFHGSGATPKEDVEVVNCPDEYYALTDKTKAKIRYALEHGYNFCFMCFPDTYACTERLFTCGFESYDYYGNVYQHPGGPRYCQGGPGFFLSRKAMEIINSSNKSYPNEDTFIGDLLHAAGVAPVECLGFKNLGPDPLRTNNSITNHLSTQPSGYTGENMRAAHRSWLNS